MTVESLEVVTDENLLKQVENSLNITGNQFSETLKLYIAEVKGYLTSAGVDKNVVNSTLSVGCIARGVADLWNYGNGDTKLSDYFIQRVEQLRSVEVANNE